MKIICLVKFIPDVDNFKYDYEKNILIRENTKLILNPDDAAALAYALKLKEKFPDIFIELVTMGPKNILDDVSDLLRRNIDKATVISDKKFAGSDTYSTSIILSEYLKKENFDLILCGCHSLDGDTSHIPSQIAEIFNLTLMSNIIKIDEFNTEQKYTIVDVEYENTISKFKISLPAVLAISKQSTFKLPFVRYADLNLDVSQKLSIISNSDLNISLDKIGINGSLTKVVKTYPKISEKKDKEIIKNDAEGIEKVYQFLKQKGFV